MPLLLTKRFLTTAALLAFIAPALSVTPASAADKPLTREDVQAIIKDYLINNPEAVVESLKKYQEKQASDQAAKAKSALKDRAADLFQDPASPVAGNVKGDITVVEFFDYHCGYCKRALPVITQLLNEDKNVRVVFKEFPILSPDSELASKAALAVYHAKPEKYFAYHTALMAITGKFDEAAVLAAAKKLGLEEEAVKKAMDSKEVTDELAKTRDLASSLGIQGTPSFIVGGQLFPGSVSYEDLKKSIADARKEKKDAK